MGKEKKDKKAEMTSTTLVTTIILIVGFAILLYLLISQLYGPGTIDKEVCHQSVVVRATVPNLVESYVPLQCKTEKICITTKIFGGKCSEYTNLKGITYIRVKSVQDVERAIADNIVDCWSMMGEGKLGLFDSSVQKYYGLGSISSTCIVCSRIAFDKESLVEKKISLSEMNVENYMRTRMIQGKEMSYSDYLAGESGKFTIGNNISGKLELPEFTEATDANGNKILKMNGSNNQIVELIDRDEFLKEIERQKNDYELQTKNLAILFMQISSPKHGESFFNILGTAGLAGGAIAGTSSGVVGVAKTGKWISRLARPCVASGPGALICGSILLIAGITQQGQVAYNRDISEAKCGDVSIGSEAREGCSVVRTLNYDENSIKQYCGVIESIP